MVRDTDPDDIGSRFRMPCRGQNFTAGVATGEKQNWQIQRPGNAFKVRAKQLYRKLHSVVHKNSGAQGLADVAGAQRGRSAAGGKNFAKLVYNLLALPVAAFAGPPGRNHTMGSLSFLTWRRNSLTYPQEQG
jgi:hypothetical protein